MVSRGHPSKGEGNCAAELDIEPEGIVAIIASIQRTHFFKSMTTYHDHTRWQDVYYVPYETIELYVKFSINDKGHVIVSFKEKG